MEDMSYVEIPSTASPLNDIPTILPSHIVEPVLATTPSTLPSKPTLNLTQFLIQSSLSLPSPPPTSPRKSKKGTVLLSNKDALSVPITTANFRRFVSRSAPIFWLQDRIEEVLLWKRGWGITCAWMAAYSLLCWYPRLLLILPQSILLSILLYTHSTKNNSSPEAQRSASSAVLQQLSEGSAAWYANLQAIQNLMGFVADGIDVLMVYLPVIVHDSRYTNTIFVFLFVSTVAMIPLLAFVPLRLVFLLLGLAPLVLTNPLVWQSLRASYVAARPWIASQRMILTRIVDDDKLQDRHWRSPMREVYLWENERFSPPTGSSIASTSAAAGWSKGNLKAGERKAWTRGRDGWSSIQQQDTVLSNLTFPLDPGWQFVETETWSVDYTGSWSEGGAGEDGWVYTNDAWQEPQPFYSEEWKNKGAMTRRRRWLRRIYYTPPLPVTTTE